MPHIIRIARFVAVKISRNGAVSFRVQDWSHAQQQLRAQGLNLAVAAIILWNTLELAQAIEELQHEGVEMTGERLRHLSPMDWEHIGLTGDYTRDFSGKSPRT